MIAMILITTTTLHHRHPATIITIIITREKLSQVTGDTEDLEVDIMEDIMEEDMVTVLIMVTNITDIVITTAMDMCTAMKRNITINNICKIIAS